MVTERKQDYGFKRAIDSVSLKEDLLSWKVFQIKVSQKNTEIDDLQYSKKHEKNMIMLTRTIIHAIGVSEEKEKRKSSNENQYLNSICIHKYIQRRFYKVHCKYVLPFNYNSMNFSKFPILN